MVASRLRSLIVASVASFALFGCGGGSSPDAADAAPRDPAAQLGNIEKLARYVVGAEADRSGPTDPQYFADGVWHNDDGRCWYCAVGPGVTSAALWRYGTNDKSRARFRRLAIQTFDAMIVNHQAADGSFGPPLKGQEGGGIATMFAGTDLATALIVLGPSLDVTTRRRWSDALQRATRFVGGTFGSFYVNGNINLGLSLLAAMTEKVAPTPEFKALSRSTRAFALFPQTPQATGFGLRIFTEPKRADGSDGAAALAERGAGGVGYDPEYTTLQSDLLARAYVLLRRPADLRLLNLLANQLRPSLDAATFELDTSTGTRHTDTARRVPYLSPVPTVLGVLGRRAGYASLARRQFPRLRTELLGALRYSYDNMYRSVGIGLGTALMAGTPAPGTSTPPRR